MSKIAPIFLAVIFGISAAALFLRPPEALTSTMEMVVGLSAAGLAVHFCGCAKGCSSGAGSPPGGGV